MVLDQLANLFAPRAATASPDGTPAPPLSHSHSTGDVSAVNSLWADGSADAAQPQQDDEVDLEDTRPPYIHSALAGGTGGMCGDMLLHSLDTVKTRQQGDPHWPPKYSNLANSYWTILRQEGVSRGLYGGVAPAFIGSFSGTCIFFGSYEFSKRQLIDYGIAPSVAYLAAGFFADLMASPIYVPTEVLKTRLQLQGRYNNPHFSSGYNYKSTSNAMRSILRTEGMSALFHGYAATLWRDLPFSALQFAFYEKEREAAKWWVGSKTIGLPLEILVGFTAGGAAGVLTCPFDVVKTRLQTQLRVQPGGSSRSANVPTPASDPSQAVKSQYVRLDSSSMVAGLRKIYAAEGIAGCFRGVGPRGVWTAIQSGTMLVLYQVLLGKLEQYPLVRD